MAEPLALSLRLNGFDEASVALGKLGRDGQRANEQVQKSAEKASGEVRTFARTLSSIAAVAASTTAILSVFAHNNEVLQESLEKATVAFTIASAGLRGLGAAARFVVSPIGLIVTAVTAAVAIFLAWDKVSRAVVTGAMATWRALGEFFSRLLGNLADMFRGLADVISGVFRFDWGQLKRGLDEIATGAAGIKTQFVEVGTAAVDMAKRANDALQSLLFGEKELEKALDRIEMSVKATADREAELNDQFKVLSPTAKDVTEAMGNALDAIERGFVATADAEREAHKELEALKPTADDVLKTITDRLTEIEAGFKVAADAEREWANELQAGGITAFNEQFLQLNEQLRQVPQFFRDIADAAGVSGAQTQQAWSSFTTWFGTQMLTIQDISKQTWQTFADGVGRAVGQAVVFGENLGDSMKNLLKQIAAAVIASLVTMLVQYAIAWAVGSTILASETGSRIGAAAAESAAWAAASAFETFGIFGFALAAELAAGAAAMTIGSAAVAFGVGEGAGRGMIGVGAAQGGLEDVPATGTFLLHRGERVLSRRQNLLLEDFLDRDGGGGPVVVQHFHLSNVVMDELGWARFLREIDRGMRSRYA